ncbi:hypothetical protein [Streptomyces sp. MH60]|uniref:hypothetical protein n=1 Tax=Streptomyces sp. MH60 TaxID=1940758 RepID=UPI000CEE4E37
MSTTPHGAGRVDLRPRRVTPRRLGAAAAVYGVFVAGWYLGQPVAPECRADQAAIDRAAERYRTQPSPTPAPIAGPASDSLVVGNDHVMSLTYTSYAVACTNDTSERPRLGAWFEGDWR